MNYVNLALSHLILEHIQQGKELELLLQQVVLSHPQLYQYACGWDGHLEACLGGILNMVMQVIKVLEEWLAR